MIVASIDHRRLQLVPESFEDLRNLKDRVSRPDYQVHRRRSWRDTYHGWQERSLIEQVCRVRTCWYETPRILRVEGRTPRGTPIKFAIGLGESILIAGPDHWYRGWTYAKTVTRYYVGVDQKSLIHGKISQGRFVQQGAQYHNLRDISPAHLEARVMRILDHARDYPRVLATTRGLNLRVPDQVAHLQIQGYAELAWRDFSPQYRWQDQVMHQIRRAQSRHCLHTLSTYQGDPGLIHRVLVDQQVPAPEFARVLRLVSDDRIEVYPHHTLNHLWKRAGVWILCYY